VILIIQNTLFGRSEKNLFMKMTFKTSNYIISSRSTTISASLVKIIIEYIDLSNTFIPAIN
jgi:hypothetical protein